LKEVEAVVVAGTEAGRVRVGCGLEFGLVESEDAVEGVIPSGFAAVVGAMGEVRWMGIGGILDGVG
jgi:hypothetical protein